MILGIVKKFIRSEEILLITSNIDSKNTSDIDIHCITTGKSSVHLFKGADNVWTEIFIDHIDDVYKKIENVDEIAINFIRELDFIFGDKNLHDELFIKIEKHILNYKIPEKRKNIIKYRIKVLLSKYLNPISQNDRIQQRFVLNSMNYPLIQLVFDYYKVFPSSPKKWIQQLREKIPTSDFGNIERFIMGDADKTLVKSLCDKYAGNLDNMEFDKSIGNDITFIS